MAENVLVKLKRGSASNLPSVRIDGTIYFAQGFDKNTADDNSNYNIFYIDTLDGTSTVVRRPLDAYRAAVAQKANSATTATRWSASKAFSITDGTNTGTPTAIDGSQSTYTLNLPATIAANIVGNLTGIADKAKAIVDSTGSPITTASNKPVYINNGVPTVITDTLDISISGVASQATRLAVSRGDATHPVYFQNGQPVLMASINGIGSTTQFIYMDAAGELKASDADVGSNIKFIYLDNGILTATSQTVGAANKPVYMENGEIKEMGSSINATASYAQRLSTSAAGDDGTPVYFSDGRPTAVDKINASLIDGVIDISNIPKAAQERFYIIPEQISNDTDLAAEVQRLINNDTLQAGDVFQNGPGGQMYFLHDDNGSITYSAFTAGAASSAQTAVTAQRWATQRQFWIGDGSGHDGTTRAIDGSSATDLHTNGTYGYRLYLPSTIAADFIGNLEGRATAATKLQNSAGTDLSVGSDSIPVYFLNGVPTACTSISLIAAKARAWVSPRNFYIADGDPLTSTTHISSTPTAVDGSESSYYLRLPDTINATFIGNLTGKVIAATAGGVAVEGNVIGDVQGNADTATEAGQVQNSLTIRTRNTNGASSVFINGFNGSSLIDRTLDLAALVEDTTCVMNKALTAGNWQELTPSEIAGMTTGSYIVQISLDNADFVNEFFTGVMSWNAANGTGSSTDEVLLHAMGQNTEHRLYLRTKRRANAAPWIEYAADTDLDVGTAITFKFRRLL